jgi:ABC-type sugar transport system permease subunit/ABC-type glycerol-3-phosphate transport system substrate-binding protein
MLARSLALLLLLLLAAPGLAQPVEVTLFEGGEGIDFYQRVADELSRLRPDLAVSLEGDPAIADRLRIRVLEGRYPEVTNAGLDIWTLIRHGQIQPLDQWLDGPSWDGQGSWRESFLPGSLEPFLYDGKTYGVPLVTSVWSIYYNKELFDRHGWRTPSRWNELIELCTRMREQGLTPFAFQGRYAYYAEALVRHTYYQTTGPQAYQSQLSLQPGAYDNQAMVQTLDRVKSLASQSFQPGYAGMSHTEAQLEFFQGRTCMLMCGSWLYSEMQANIPEGFRLGAFPLPLPDSPLADPRAGYVTTDGFWFVFKNSPNPTGGVEFLRYLTSAEVAGRFARERGITVVVRGANQQLHPMVADVASQLQGLRRTFGKGSGESPPELGQIWNDALTRLLTEPTFDGAQAAALMETQAAQARNRMLHPERVEVRHPKKTTAFLSFLALGLLLGASSSRSRENLRASNQRTTAAVLFVAPALFFYGMFYLLPSLVALLAGLFAWDGVGPARFVGSLNFQRLLLESDTFWMALSNNLYLMLVIPAVVLPLSLLLANALHQGVWGSRVFRIAFFFPNLLGVAGILLWQQLYNPQGGPINAALVGLGLESFRGFAWLSPQHLYPALIPMGVWGACGFNMVLFLAAMQAVPEDLYEAAELHGANALEKLRYITLPMIWQTVVAALLFMLIGGMKAFEAIWLLTNQSPTSENHVVGTLMVRSMFVEQRIGQAAAIACLLFASVLVCSLLAERMLNSEGEG